MFDIGNYKTRTGLDARVKFAVSKPNNTNYPLMGEVFENDRWRQCSWTIDGKHISNNCPNNFDLMPNRVWIYWSLTRDSIGMIHHNEPVGNYLKVERLADGSYDWANAITVVRI